MFLYDIEESEENQEENRESSESLSSKTDNLEITLERNLQVKSGTSLVMRCVGGTCG